ncbi:hypothetical protein, partial [Ensifer sp. MJa1]|uniref:hypothetical protein n=1 Tax=Ensifer sp. MJa1 TaxID=2919888 RepID=UPI00300BAAE9
FKSCPRNQIKKARLEKSGGLLTSMGINEKAGPLALEPPLPGKTNANAALPAALQSPGRAIAEAGDAPRLDKLTKIETIP